MTIKSQICSFGTSTTKLTIIKQVVVFHKSDGAVGDGIPVSRVPTGHWRGALGSRRGKARACLWPHLSWRVWVPFPHLSPFPLYLSLLTELCLSRLFPWFSNSVHQRARENTDCWAPPQNSLFSRPSAGHWDSHFHVSQVKWCCWSGGHNYRTSYPS